MANFTESFLLRASKSPSRSSSSAMILWGLGLSDPAVKCCSAAALVKCDGWQSAAYARHFFTGSNVYNFKLFGMQSGIFPEVQFSEITLFNFDEMLFILRA